MHRPFHLLVVIGFLSPLAAQDWTARAEALELETPRLLELSSVPGVAAAIATRDGVVWARGFGLATGDTKVTSDTVFEAASLSKPVFAFAVMQLVDAEELDLDTSLSDYFEYPDAAHDERYLEITARHVLSHTPGFPNWRGDGKLDILSNPGTRFRYSGEGYVYLQRVLEDLTGETLEELAHRLVFEPLKMTNTSYVWVGVAEASVAIGHRENGEQYRKRHPDSGNAAYSLHTTAPDFARFMSALLNGARLHPETRIEIAEPQIRANDRVHWGLGWGLEQHREGYSLWHWGHIGGFRAYAAVYPQRDFAFVFFSNSNNGMLLLRDFARYATGGDDHPALQHLGYASHDDSAHVVALALREAFASGGVEAGIARFHELEKSHPAEAFARRVINDFGYALIRGNRKAAIAIFKLNVERHPDSYNAHDSLAEAYLLDGQLDNALASYQKSVELNSNNRTGEQRIAEIESRLK